MPGRKRSHVPRDRDANPYPGQARVGLGAIVSDYGASYRLTWAVLELSSRRWRGVVMTPKLVAEIERLRRGLRRRRRVRSPADHEEVIAA